MFAQQPIISDREAEARVDNEAKGKARGERIEAYCKTIWGNDDYDLEIDNEENLYYAWVRKDHGTHYGPLLTDSCLSRPCHSADSACIELERMLAQMCKHVPSSKQ
jgi:hypothetical protein